MGYEEVLRAPPPAPFARQSNTPSGGTNKVGLKQQKHMAGKKREPVSKGRLQTPLDFNHSTPKLEKGTGSKVACNSWWHHDLKKMTRRSQGSSRADRSKGILRGRQRTQAGDVRMGKIPRKARPRQHEP